MRLGLLLIPQPVLSLAFVAGIRADRVEPSFVPVVILAAFPLAATIAAAVRLRKRKAPPRHNWLVLALGLLELCWAVTTLAIVGFAIALRSG